MPNRIIRDGILTSEQVSQLGWAEEVFYRRLMSVVDDYGRFHASTKLLRAACYPLLIDKVSDADVGKWLTKCVTAALVSVYPASDGKRYLQIEKFGQQVRAKSKFPEPGEVKSDHVKSFASNCYQSPANAHLVVSVFEDVIVSEGVVDKSKCAEAPSEQNATPKRFVKPSLDEVKTYCAERGGKVVADRWFNHYESNGWMVGRNKMRDWKATVRKWEDNATPSANQQAPPRYQNRQDISMAAGRQIIEAVYGREQQQQPWDEGAIDGSCEAGPIPDFLD